MLNTSYSIDSEYIEQGTTANSLPSYIENDSSVAYRLLEQLREDILSGSDVDPTALEEARSVMRCLLWEDVDASVTPEGGVDFVLDNRNANRRVVIDILPGGAIRVTKVGSDVSCPNRGVEVAEGLTAILPAIMWLTNAFQE